MAESHIQIGDISPRIQYTADGAQTAFTYPFPIFTTTDMEVYLDDTEQSSGFTVNGAGQSAGGDVTFDTAPADDVLVTLRRRIAIQRTSDFQESGEFRAKVINDELDYQTASLQQVANDQLRTLRQSATDADDIGELPDKETRSGRVLAFDGNGAPTISNETLADLEIQAGDAAASATAAASSASAAASSATNAATSATNAGTSAANSVTSATSAAASAAAASAAVSSALWNDVVFKTFADNPIALTDGDAGKLFVVDTAGGAVTVNLPAISGLTLSNPWSVGIKKSTGDGNAVTINANGSDTIDGTSSKAISTADAGAVLIPDIDPNPDEWTSAEFGAVAGNMTVDNFADGTDFTAGTTTQLTLSTNAGSENNIVVIFNGVTQHHDTYSLSGTTLTFAEAIPAGTTDVEVVVGAALSIGTPGDATVTTAKLAASAVTLDKLADAAKSMDIPFNAGMDFDFTGEDLVAGRVYAELVLGRDITIEGDAGYLDTVATGAAVIVDVLKNGATVYSTKPQFAASANALTAGTLAVTTADADDRITFKVTQIGSTIAGQKLRFTLKCRVR